MHRLLKNRNRAGFAYAALTVSRLRNLGLVAFLAVLVLMHTGGAVQAEIILVNTADDHNDGACDNDCSLREALDKASGNFEPDEIHLVAGPVYTLTMGRLTMTVGNTTIFGLDKTIDGNGQDRALLVDIFADPGPIEIRNLTISGASIGLHANTLADVTLRNVVIRDNTQTVLGEQGAGVLVKRGAIVRIEDSLITNNAALRSGGGIFVQDSTLTVVNSTVSGNRCGLGGPNEVGGGIAVVGGSATIIGSTISGNQAAGNLGGGVFIGNAGLAGSATITNSTISGNSAAITGGLHASAPSITLESCTITDNHATNGAGGGVFGLNSSPGNVHMHNTIIAGNTATGGAPDCFGTFDSNGYNLIQSMQFCTLEGDTATNRLGEDPILGSLADNGGPTLTHTLLFGSPAIDEGDPNSFEPLDQRGSPRPIDGDGGGLRSDIGSVEILPPDCDGNGIPDFTDIANDPGLDCDQNGILDTCETDTDGDGTIDECDGCPNDPDKTSEGVCGCGVADTDSDHDETPDCLDDCPDDPEKISPGICDCGTSDTDTDEDGTADCIDGCPDDPEKVAPGLCGCGLSDTDDTDGDGVLDCDDVCPGGDDNADCDGDGTPDFCDVEPDCNGNGVPDNCDLDATDPDGDGIILLDCNANGVPDVCEIDSGDEADCNGNGVPDSCDVKSMTYDITVSDLVGLAATCPQGSSQGGNGVPLGFTWLDTTTSAVTAVAIEFNVGLECHGSDTLHATTLNGTPDGSFDPTPLFCACNATPGVAVALAASPASYAVGEPNTFVIVDTTTSMGLTPNAAWGAGVYARVMVTYDTVVADCNGNGVPDECEPDCNANDVADVCDITDMTSEDCDGDSVPDECETDADGDGIIDDCDPLNNVTVNILASDVVGSSGFCGAAFLPATCDGNPMHFSWTDPGLGRIGEVVVELSIGVDHHTIGTTHSTSLNGVPDASFESPRTESFCNFTSVVVPIQVNANNYVGGGVNSFEFHPAQTCFGLRPFSGWEAEVVARVIVGFEPPGDCNNNGVRDDIDIADQTSPDCNTNGLPDECDVLENPDDDCDGNGVPDVCEPDADGDGLTDACDLSNSIHFDLRFEDVANIGSGCPGDWPGRCFGTTSIGFAWTDNDPAPVLAARIDFGVGRESHSTGTIHSTSLNGIPDSSFESRDNRGQCGVAGVLKGVTLNPASYNVEGTNTFLITELSACFSFASVAPFDSGVLARVTVDHAAIGDCNNNGVSDDQDIADGISEDCNGNFRPDECDITLGSDDCDGNGIPDECEPDCNQNGTVDACDVDPADPDGDGQVADDCNGNGVPDDCDLPRSTTIDIGPAEIVSSQNCSAMVISVNGAIGFTWLDTTGAALESVRIELNIGVDCNDPGVVHATELNGMQEPSFTSARRLCTCTPNPSDLVVIDVDPGHYNVGQQNTFLIPGLPVCLGFAANTDWGETVYARVILESGQSTDNNGNGIPDECDSAGDFNGDGFVDLDDHEEFAMCLTGAGGGLPPGCEPADTDGDGDVDLFDFAAVLIGFGAPQ